MEPLYPDVEVRLVGEDGNAFSIIGRCRAAVRRAARRGVFSQKEAEAIISDFTEEATAGDYDDLLQTVTKYFGTC